MSETNYLKIGRASELSGWDKVIYRMLEILPGFLSWGTILGVIFLSWYRPVWAAIFIIVFDVYWLTKTVYLSIHLRANYKKMKHNMTVDWQERLSNMKWQHLYQMVILPFGVESFEVIVNELESLLKTRWPNEKIIVVLSGDEWRGGGIQKIIKSVEKEYGNKFGHFFTTTHPDGISGEMRGKGSNISWAAEEARVKVLDKYKIDYKNVLVSAFDVDTEAYPQYFSCLAWNFLTAEKPLKCSFQPVPLFNNNIWQASALSRVVATSATFWQMVQQERPEKLSTFSSHSMVFSSLYEMGYWQKNMVSEDSRIFWNFLIFNNADYQVIPISYPVSMDANIAPTFLKTMRNVYKQQRRWTWGVENIPYLLFNFIKNKSIPLGKKLKYSFVQIEGFWSLATAPILIFLLGWLPLTLGGIDFNTTLLSYNLPRITRTLMTIAMLGLVGSAIVSLKLLPERPKDKKRGKYFYMIFQWVLIPVTILFFGAIPGLDAQIRLMFGRYMGFWPTPKYRK